MQRVEGRTRGKKKKYGNIVEFDGFFFLCVCVSVTKGRETSASDDVPPFSLQNTDCTKSTESPNRKREMGIDSA